MNSGMIPPLVSHRHSTDAPASCAASSVCSAYSRIGAEGVEEVLGVVDHLPAGLAHQPDGVADHREVFFQA